MAEIKCPCGLRHHMEEEDCKNTNCNDCCPLTRPQTNADRIRAMSDEELAVLLVEEKEYGVTHEQYFICPDGKEFNEGEHKKAVGYTLDWLKQPADEERDSNAAP